MAKTMKCSKVRKIEEDDVEDPEFQTQLEPKMDDEDDGVFKLKIWSDSRILEKGDEVALKNVSDLLQKAEGQGSLEGFSDGSS